MNSILSITIGGHLPMRGSERERELGTNPPPPDQRTKREKEELVLKMFHRDTGKQKRMSFNQRIL